jgi:hypothetical protein
MRKVRSRIVTALAIGLVGCLFGAAAHARPPTVTFSPGYDARLAESRQRLWASQYNWQNYHYTSQPRVVRRFKKPPRWTA